MRAEALIGVLVCVLYYASLHVEGQSVSGLTVRPRCGPICRMHCQFGFVTDHRGCPICRCRSRPLPKARCPRNSRPVIPQRTCALFSIRPRRCGRNAFCSPAPTDGPGICCRRLRPTPRPRPIGQCPLSNRITTCQFTTNNCLSDRECRFGQRCCPDGCGRVCKRVRPFPFIGYPRSVTSD